MAQQAVITVDHTDLPLLAAGGPTRRGQYTNGSLILSAKHPEDYLAVWRTERGPRRRYSRPRSPQSRAQPLHPGVLNHFMPCQKEAGTRGVVPQNQDGPRPSCKDRRSGAQGALPGGGPAAVR